MQRYFSSNHNRSALLLGFTIMSMLVLLGRAGFLVVQSMVSLAGSRLSFTDLGPSILEALSMVLCAVLLLPLTVGCIQQLQGKQLPAATFLPIKIWWLVTAAITWLVLLIISSLLTALLEIGWLLSAPTFLLGMLLAVATLAWMAAGGLVSGSRRRLWAAFSLGMTGGTGLALVLEYALIAVVVVVGAAAVLVRPEFGEMLNDLQARVATAGSMEEILTQLAPYLTQPWVLLLVLAFVAGLGPLIEEAVKPLAVWLLGRRLHSPAEGFALGALSGAGFALLEGLMAASGMAATPYFGLPARLASSLMHIILSGIMGWGIAQALLKKRWKRLAGIYLLCAGLHGLWNGSALLAVYGSLRTTLQGNAMDPVSILAMLGGVSLLGIELVAMATVLLILNKKLRPAAGDIIAPLENPLERKPDGLD